MPNKPSKPCPGRGPRRGSCSNLIKGNDKVCIECMEYEKKANREYDKQRDQTPERQFLHSTAWRRERDDYLNENPLCERCFNADKIEPAVLVHHKDRNELNRAKENKESLCFTCHEEEHKKERWGSRK